MLLYFVLHDTTMDDSSSIASPFLAQLPSIEVLWNAFLHSGDVALDCPETPENTSPSFLSAEVHDDSNVIEESRRQRNSSRQVAMFDFGVMESEVNRGGPSTSLGDEETGARSSRRRLRSPGADTASNKKPRGRPRVEITPDTVVDVCTNRDDGNRHFAF